MNMNGVNPGSAMNAMANGANGVRSGPDNEPDIKTTLNTYIYDYLIINEAFDVAEAMSKSALALNLSKTVPSKRSNGVEDSGEDSKDDVYAKKPPDLPYPSDILSTANGNSFLLDWFQLFLEMWRAPRGKEKVMPDAVRYIEHAKVCCPSVYRCVFS